ncbi:MAG: glycosyl transferase [Hyphomonadaceae bacterium]
MTTKIAFFGHDAADAAIRRRIRSFTDDGIEVTGFMMRRGEAAPTEWTNIDLGQTRDGAFTQRAQMVFKGAKTAATHGTAALYAADLFYARNLDMLASAFLAKRRLKLKTPVVYECLDVHRMMVGSGPVARVLRFIERQLLKRCAGLVVSSPGFLKNYFEVHHKGLYQSYLVENRLVSGADYGPRPALSPVPTDRPLRVGWFGILRCSRSLGLLASLAETLGDSVEVHLHGKVATTEITDFDETVAKHPNMFFSGAYKSPEDLTRIYQDADIIWAGDFMEAGYNSVWLLPNRIYEGGYYTTPAIAPKGTQTGHWIDAAKCGFTLAEPLTDTLPELVRHLQGNRQEIGKRREILLELPEETFIQPHGEMGSIIKRVLQARL